MSNIIGIHYPKLKGQKSHPLYILQGKNGILYRQAQLLNTSDVEKFNILMSNQISQLFVQTRDGQLFVKNQCIDLPDVDFDDEINELPPTEIQSKNLTKGRTILSYDKFNNKFYQSDRIDLDNIKNIITWDHTTLGNKKFVMLCIQENKFVKLDDLKQKNSSLLLDYVLSQCIFIK